MSYEKRTWKIGEEITADKLNHMEDGIAAGGSGGGSEKLVVHITTNEDINTLDKTWQEIHDAMPNVVVNIEDEDSNYTTIIQSLEVADGEYLVRAANTTYRTSSNNGYPSTSGSN